MMHFIKSPLFRFLLFFALLYVGWFILYDSWLHPIGKLDEEIIYTSIIIAQNILELFGYIVFTDGDRIIGIEGTSGLWVGDSCNAITLVALFAGFIIAYPGKWNKKLLYITLCGLTIFFLNILRIVFLAIIDTHSRNWTEFNHTYTFTLLMYGYIFYLWYLWIEKFSGSSLMPQKNR